MEPFFENDIDWAGNPSPESARFRQTFHPENAFMSFHDSSIDGLFSSEAIETADEALFERHILKGPGTATILPSDALDINITFHFEETPPDLADPSWAHVAEGIIKIDSGKMLINEGDPMPLVAVRMNKGNYAFRVYFAKPVWLPEEDGDEDSQNLAIYFHKTQADESNEIIVLKQGAW